MSMTGYGEASYHDEALSVAIELRSLNNRYLKVMLRAPEPYNLLEPEFERVVRKTVKRGTVQIHLRCQRPPASQDYQVNATALRSYVQQLRGVAGELRLRDWEQGLLGPLLALPGVVPEPGVGLAGAEEHWPVLERVLQEALARLQGMRQEEGRAMAAELLQLRDQIGGELGRIRERTSDVVTAYRDRLLERVKALLAEADVKLERSDLIKDVSVFAERSDIAEEVVRLASHLDQFAAIVAEPESAGRKLEFLTQEMFREANTIGSKASDVVISQQVVEIKSALEKVREMVQNVE